MLLKIGLIDEDRVRLSYIHTRLVVALFLSALIHVASFQLVDGLPIKRMSTIESATPLAIVLRSKSALSLAFPIVSESESVSAEADLGDLGAPVAKASRSDRNDDGQDSGSSNRAIGDAVAGIGLRYYRSQELDERPSPIESIPDFSLLAALNEGHIVLRLLISPVGIVDRVSIDESYMISPEQEAFIANVFRATVFKPGMISHQAVPSMMLIQVDVKPTVQ